MKRVYLFGMGLSSLAMLAACSPSNSDVFGSGGSAASGHGATTTTDVGSSQGGSGSGTDSTGAFMTGATGTGAGTCTAGPNEDHDHDGWTIAQGDCNDCDPNVNPGAIEVIVTQPDPMTGMVPPPVDEDCDGQIDNVPQPCDTGLAFDSLSAMDAAKAIELCKQAAGPKDYGVISADYVDANGSGFNHNNAQHGILANFGPNVAPKGGSSLLALSSGRARLPMQAGACANESCTAGAGSPPPNFPQAVPGCLGSANIFDDVGLEVQLRAPSNATGYSFAFKFHSWEFPEWVCTAFNDQFIALVDPAPMGSNNGNISFDTDNNPVSVNIAFFDVCDPSLCPKFAQHCVGATCPSPASCTCPAGPTQLTGTGFDNAAVGDAGGTVWLQTTAPIKGSDSFTIRFAIWDTGDENLDSTTLVDNFQWIAQGGTVVVGTTPVPN